MSQYVIFSPVWHFRTTLSLSCKGPISRWLVFHQTLAGKNKKVWSECEFSGHEAHCLDGSLYRRNKATVPFVGTMCQYLDHVDELLLGSCLGFSCHLLRQQWNT